MADMNDDDVGYLPDLLCMRAEVLVKIAKAIDVVSDPIAKAALYVALGLLTDTIRPLGVIPPAKTEPKSAPKNASIHTMPGWRKPIPEPENDIS